MGGKWRGGSLGFGVLVGLVGSGCVGSVRRVYGYEDYNVLTYGILFSCTFALAVSGWCSIVLSAEASVCAVEEDLACLLATI